MLPIFIGGCSRSGTTMLGAMLGAHSKCVCTPESQFKIEALRHLKGSASKVNDALTAITDHWSFKTWHIEDALDRATLKASYPDFLKGLVSSYAKKSDNDSDNIEPRVWVDHTPDNLQHSATLLRLFPDAKFIHIVRDGRGVSASVIPLDWGPNTIYISAHWWVENIGYALAAESFLTDKRIMRVRYEDLLTNPEATIKKICEFAEIEFEASMTSGKGFDKPVYTSKQHSLVGKEPDPARLIAWKDQLTHRQIELFEDITGDTLELLGYETACGGQTTAIKDSERFSTMAYECYRYFTNRFNFWRRLKLTKK